MSQSIEYSLDEISTHNTEESLWIAISGSVYDVTDFLNKHPGSAKPLLKHAGKDATKSFMKVKKHAKNENLPTFMKSLCIGKLKQ